MNLSTAFRLCCEVCNLFQKMICTLLSYAYNTFMQTMMVFMQTKTKQKVNTMSATITLNKNRKNAAIFIAHKVLKTKKPLTDGDIHEAAERHMTNHKPGAAVVEVIKNEVKRLLTTSKGKVDALPPIAAPLGTVTPAKVAEKPTKKAEPKGKGEAVKKAVAAKKPKRALKK